MGFRGAARRGGSPHPAVSRNVSRISLTRARSIELNQRVDSGASRVIRACEERRAERA